MRLSSGRWAVTVGGWAVAVGGWAVAVGVSLALAVVSVADAASGGSTWPACTPRPAATQIGIRELSHTRQGRLLTLQLFSAAMGEVQPVDVLLPPHYDASGRTRYHVLYLFHGAGGSYRTWIAGKLTLLLGTLPIITVMPNGSEHGHDGTYTDWTEMPVGDSARAPAWETYHVRELVPFIDRRFPTLSGPAGHAVAGISMGGGGATKYAAEYPGTFGYAGTFSRRGASADAARALGPEQDVSMGRPRDPPGHLAGQRLGRPRGQPLRRARVHPLRERDAGAV